MVAQALSDPKRLDSFVLAVAHCWDIDYLSLNVFVNLGIAGVDVGQRLW